MSHERGLKAFVLWASGSSGERSPAAVRSMEHSEGQERVATLSSTWNGRKQDGVYAVEKPGVTEAEPRGLEPLERGR